MSGQVLTGTGAAFATTLTVPAGGDPRNAASVKTPFQVVLDNLLALARLVPTSVVAVQRQPWVRSADNVVFLDHALVDSSDVVQQELELPNGAELTNVTCLIDPANATPPAGVKPFIRIVRYDTTTGASSVLHTGSTDATSGASYGAPHDLSTGTITGVTIDRTKYRYFTAVVWESSTGASTGDVYGARATYNVTAPDRQG